MDVEFEVDALRLNNLLFRGENVVDPRDVSMPTDLTLLGNLAPKRTSLVISPSEPIVASGQVIDFTAESELGGVTWKVENLPGEKGETGGSAIHRMDDIRRHRMLRCVPKATAG